MAESFAVTIDVREIPPFQRHPLIFGRFNELRPGEALQLVNDHDPRPLHYQFQALNAGQFTWDYLESGPALWRVRIGKLAGAAAVAPAAGGSCCSGGSCG
ncbi:MAG: hypothetical protein AMXMBFR45_06770 [Gammaproteobacteria bacterium]|jgi:uncharacterized protein (DUF2249 family)|nr:MAG: DUF2249 domain-containing protein [Pseudomonadota bacterium]MBC6944875.1 DUF2249 domain-containing protein [Gammaproteobacteria bacterium]MCE7895783.1 DUF2249 domain-containing protein [Gammaproteobacteria bacterium PRO8]MDL1879693.1 DUF2249 domain-containing protein [Gammaproteobacteria bacterium PRO2]MCQ3933644.1 aminotransferase [Gammaproteobacteria bacterium]